MSPAHIALEKYVFSLLENECVQTRMHALHKCLERARGVAAEARRTVWCVAPLHHCRGKISPLNPPAAQKGRFPSAECGGVNERKFPPLHQD
jgi:hypothetical protein